MGGAKRAQRKEKKSPVLTVSPPRLFSPFPFPFSLSSLGADGGAWAHGQSQHRQGRRYHESMGSAESRSPHLFSWLLPLVPPQDRGVMPTPGTGAGTAAACSRPSLLHALMSRPAPAPTPVPLPPSPLGRPSFSQLCPLLPLPLPSLACSHVTLI